MPRLTQSTGNTAASNTSVGNTPQTTQPVQSQATSTVRAVRSRRRYPLWLLPVLLIAVGVSGTELWLYGTQRAYIRALDTAQVSQTKYRMTLLVRNSAWYTVSPTGDKFAVGYTSNRESYLEVRRISGELLWKAKGRQGFPAFSQDGALVFHGKEVLQAETGKRLAQAPVEKYGTDISWDSRGQRVALGNRTSIQVWDKASNKTRSLAIPFPLESRSETYRACADTQISPDGKWVATMVYCDRPEESTLLLWNLDTAGKPRVFPVYQVTNSSFGLAFSPDSKTLLYSGESANINLGRGESWIAAWAVDTGQTVLSIHPSRPGFVVAWSPDSQYAAVRSDGWTLYQVATGKLVWQAPLQENSVYDSMTFTTDNKLYFYEDDRKKGEWSLKYWDLARVLNRQGEN